MLRFCFLLTFTASAPLSPLDQLEQKLNETIFAQIDPILEEKTNVIKINSQLGVAENVFQGDINLSPEQRDEINSPNVRNKRQAISLARKWTNNTVYFYFDEAIEDKKRNSVHKALNLLASKTCLTFVENSSNFDRVKVINGSGCTSFVGMIGGEQWLSLGANCDHTGTAAHEFLHSLGMEHTHDRFDRDNFILINTADINLLYLGAFNLIDPFRMVALVPYEYGSVMHYGANSFTSGINKISIVAKNTNYTYTMGGGIPSFYDFLAVNTFYNCQEQACPNSTLKCKNGGMVNPKNCNECFCPSGYGGSLCEQKPTGCGQSYTATTDWQNVTMALGDPASLYSNDYTYCNYWLEAPTGKKIEIKIVAMTNPMCSFGCFFNGIELKLDVNPQPTGARFCCAEFLDRSLVSDQNPMPIIHYNSFSQSIFVISFRAIDVPCGEDHPLCSETESFCGEESYPLQYRRHFCPRKCQFC